MSAVVNGGHRNTAPPPTPPAAPAAHRDRRPLRPVTAMLGALSAAILGYLVVATALLPGVVTGLLLCLLVVALPTSESLSRRIALAGTVLLGWTPALWWFRWPVEVDHGAVVAALVAGLLAGWLLVDKPARSRVLPRWRVVDALPLLVGVVTAGLMTRWLLAGTPRGALHLLLRGYDNVAHFSMFEMQRRSGVMADELGASTDGTTFHYAPYPQGFHALAATFADVVGAPGVSGGPTALPAYTLTVALVVVVAMVVLSAALSALPPLRRRPAIALPVVAVVAGAFLVGPGGSTLADGFAPFWYASALVAVGIVLSLGWVRVAMPLQVTAVAGAMAGVAQAWAPMCLLLAPAVLCGLLPLRRSRWRATPTMWTLCAVLALFGLVGIARPALLLLRTVAVGDVVTAVGGFSPPDPARLLLIVLVALAGACGFPVLRRRSSSRTNPLLRRTSLLGLVVVVALVSATGLALAQLRRTGTPDYYFFKYVVGVELVLVTVVAAAAGLLLAARAPRRSTRRAWLPAALVVVFVPVLVSPSPARPALLDADRSVTVRYPTGTSTDALARSLMGASRVAPSAPGAAVLVALPPGSTDQAIYAQRWLMALTGTWTVGADRVSAPLVTKVQDVPGAARVAGRVLSRHRDTVVLVPPADLAAVRSAMGDPSLAARVVTWGDGR